MLGKEGQLIAAPCLTVREEPLVPAGMGSRGCDGEGVPKTPRALIEAGVLTTYLHNSYTANRAKAPNTGHASRTGGSAGVGIGVSNLQMDCGQKTEAELIAELDEGLYITYGGLQPDATTGDISATVDFGFKIEKGQLAYPVATTMIGSDIFEMLRNIDAVSSDYREEPGSITPSLRVRDIMVIGGE
jgi:PmbA protein